MPPLTYALPPQPCGIALVRADQLAPVYLPLEELDVHAEIVDVSATVTLTQSFWQYCPDSVPITRAKYVFPVPAKAAVCGFEMRTEDGRVITAVAKEKETARKEHEQAIREGKLTGLVEHVRDDVFAISLGSLPQLQMLTTKLTYIMDLMEDEQSDQVRLQLPVCIGQRYGRLPRGMVDAKTIPPERISITSEVYMRGAIQSITSPSHPTLSIVDGVTLETNANLHGQTAKFHSQDFLSQDFVLLVKAEGLDAARCFAERGTDGSVALQFTVAPQGTLPTIVSQEYIFLVDRSGSMKGSRIDTAKRALVMLLRALPRNGTSFNIFSFGFMCRSLWKESRAYNEKTLDEATKHVDSMDANYRGTKICSALQKVFKSRCAQLHTACFLLTDGESWDAPETIAATKKAADNAKPGAPLRVFTLGIGSTTSTEMCEGISRVSGGMCLMAITSESIVGKCSKLVKASRSEILVDVTFNWGVHVDASNKEKSVDAAKIAFRQGPQTTASIYGGIRYVVFALINDPEYVVPDEVVVKARCTGTRQTFESSVPVEQLHRTTNSEPQRPMIHTLAARRIIMDLEDQERDEISEATKAAIIYLGERHQLASKFTSFIAVDAETKERLDVKTEFERDSKEEEMAAGIRRMAMLVGSAPGNARMAPGTLTGTGVPIVRTQARRLARKSSGVHVELPSLASIPSIRSLGASFKSALVVKLERSVSMVSQAPGETHVSSSTAASLVPASPSPAPTSPSQPAPAISPQPREITEPIAARVEVDELASIPPPSGYSSSPKPTGDMIPPQAVSEATTTSLVRLQSFDGAFRITDALVRILGKEAIGEATKVGVDKTVWATVLAIAYLQKHLANQPELLEGLVEKAKEYVREAGQEGTNFEELLRRAASFVA